VTELEQEIAHLKELQAKHRKNIRTLEEMLANYGMDRPLHLVNALDFEQEQLRQVEEELAAALAIQAGAEEVPGSPAEPAAVSPDVQLTVTGSGAAAVGERAIAVGEGGVGVGGDVYGDITVIRRAEPTAEVEVELDHQREATLQAYFDQMTELLQKGLRKSESGAEMRTIARARTRTALRQLDGGRKGALLQFLYEAELIGSVEPIDDASRQLPIIHIGEAGDLRGLVLSRTTMWGIDLKLADLNEANLRGLDLYGAILQGVDLSGAVLLGVNLCKADLRAANLRDVKVSESVFVDADLRNADLGGADLEGAYLRQAKYDSNTKWPKGFNPVSAGAILED
jgi:hypothetical protein